MKKLLVSTIMALLVISLSVAPIKATSQIPITMKLTNASVREVLVAIGSLSGINIIVDDSVTGNVTFEWHRVPFENCLNLLTKTKGLTYQNFGNVIVVATPERMTKGFGNVHIIKMQYAKASEIVETLSIMFEGSDKKDASAGAGVATQGTAAKDNKAASSKDKKSEKSFSDRFKVDDATNSIVFLGSDNEVEKIRDMLNSLDIPYQQVSLEAQVVEINKTASKQLGLEWSWADQIKYPEFKPGTPGTLVTQADGTKVYSGQTPDTYTRDKGDMTSTIRFGRSPAGIPYEFYYKTKINAIISKGDGKILARPKITTINGKEAHIIIGASVPIPTTTTANNQTQTSYEYRDVGIKLVYTPQINVDGQITAKVHTEVSDPMWDANAKAYQFNTRIAETQVRMKDGETMVIGGLIGSNESHTNSKVPILSDIPIIGALFKNVNNQKRDSEVIVFLTARIVK